VPEAGARYSVSLEFTPSKDVKYASVSRNDGFIVDGFTCTNSVYFPDDISRINELNANFGKATGQPRKK